MLGRVFPKSKWIFIPRTKCESNAENSVCAATGFEFENLLPVLEKAGFIEPTHQNHHTGDAVMYKVRKKELQDWVENALPQQEHSYTEKRIRDENGVPNGTFHFLSNGKCLDKDPCLKFPQKPPRSSNVMLLLTRFA